MARVGQYQGPDGTAALAVVAPVWNIIYSLGLLMGIGGSVIFSTKRGSGERDGDSGNEYFTAAVIGSVLLAALAWGGLLLFERPLLVFFGADETLLALAQRYMLPVRAVFPLFLFNQMLAAFLRNDGDPGLATVGVLSGGIFNVFGDWFFVFPCDMGVFGAGLATALGSLISFLVMLTHFAHCVLSACRGPYAGCAYSVGQAAQPIISTNFGAGKAARIRETLCALPCGRQPSSAYSGRR